MQRSNISDIEVSLEYTPTMSGLLACINHLVSMRGLHAGMVGTIETTAPALVV